MPSLSEAVGGVDIELGIFELVRTYGY